MAIARGAGTEIIRSAHFEDVPGAADYNLIVGVQHHIYTVLSISLQCFTLNTAGDSIVCLVRGYDSYAGTTAQANRLFKFTPSATEETYMWNDKFSFNGYEPVDFNGPLTTAVQQDAIADQGSSVAQKLQVSGSRAATLFDIHITFIDQNNA
jgi:hypothetical protein